MIVGVLGASGFIGNRTVEMLYASGVEVRPILRSTNSIHQLSCSSLDCRIADALNQDALQSAFTGCEVVIHSVLGSPGLIRGSVAPAYKAAQRAGVRRLIYLSSMCVHSQCPPPGTTEETTFNHDQPFPYNSAKIYAERKLLQMRIKGSVEVVIFRPGIVFGPRSRWVSELAEQLLQGTAYLIDEGMGICNTVYIDNLVHAMRLALSEPKADSQAFFVGDRERVTWLDFYRPFAEALRVNAGQIPFVPVPEFNSPSLKQKLLANIWSSELVQKALISIPDQLKQTLKSLPKRSQLQLSESEGTKAVPQIVVSQELALLQQTQLKLPLEKAEKLLSYEPMVSFENACKRSIDWLITERQKR